MGYFTKRVFALGWLAGVSTLGLIASPAFAGQAAPRSESKASSEGLDSNDIIVTAQRRSERLEAVPLSITAVSAGTLERSGITRFQDLGNLSAGVQVSRTGAFTQPSIRGITTLTTGLGYENNVAVYIDGFYQPDTVSINGDFANVSDVQILKGPQGTLYGRNATGGAILINTLAPSKNLTGSLNLVYGRFDDKRMKAYFSGPITENVGFSLAGYYRDSNGYIKDIDATGRKDFDAAPVKNASLRAKLQVEPADGVKFTLGYNHVYVFDARGLVFTEYANAPAFIDTLPGRATRRNTSSMNVAPRNGLKLDEGTLKSEFETGIGKLTTHTSYAKRSLAIRFDFDGSKLPISITNQYGIEKTFQQAADFSVTAIDKLDLVVGGLYYNDDNNGNFTPVTNGVAAATQFTRLRTVAGSVYFDATYHLTDKLFLTGGARYSRERKHLQYHTSTGAPLPADTAKTFSSLTPRAVLRYELADRTNVYASYTQGFRSGTFPLSVQLTPALALPIKPEKIYAYEIGFKTANRLIRFDTAAFYYDYRNLQVGLTVPDPTCAPGAPCGITTLVGNAKRAKSYGAEASITITPIAGLNLRANGAYTHARYTDFNRATGTGLDATTGLNVSGQAQNWNGQQAARAPTWTGNIGADYSVQFAGGKATLSANGSYTSSFVVGNASLYGPTGPAGLTAKQRFRQKAYGLLNMSLGWTDAQDRFSIAVYSDNLTNTKYLIVSSGGAFGDYRQYGEPVTYGVKTGYKF